MKIPSADHPITITPNPQRVRVTAGGKVIADSTSALALTEASYAVVNYIPREDVDMSLLTRSTRQTHCPYKGDASYFSVEIDSRIIENAVWSYETPFPAMGAISGYLAFYPNKVDAIEELPA